MSHPRVERIEKILEMASNFKNKSDQSFKKHLKEKIEEEKEEAKKEKDPKRESFEEMLDRLMFEEQIKK